MCLAVCCNNYSVNAVQSINSNNIDVNYNTNNCNILKSKLDKLSIMRLNYPTYNSYSGWQKNEHLCNLQKSLLLDINTLVDWKNKIPQGPEIPNHILENIEILIDGILDAIQQTDGTVFYEGAWNKFIEKLTDIRDLVNTNKQPQNTMFSTLLTY
ncbi:MAG: hypothetical protein IJU54_02190 [Alphaproteobacteria bacterium]|nr:hypothetical protein [Alphaproteobacteria bacterium]